MRIKQSTLTTYPSTTTPARPSLPPSPSSASKGKAKGVYIKGDSAPMKRLHPSTTTPARPSQPPSLSSTSKGKAKGVYINEEATYPSTTTPARPSLQPSPSSASKGKAKGVYIKGNSAPMKRHFSAMDSVAFSAQDEKNLLNYGTWCSTFKASACLEKGRVKKRIFYIG